MFAPPKDRPIAWLIGFWSNVPATPQADPDFSYPQTLLWQVEVSADRVLQEPVGIDSFGDEFRGMCYEYSVLLKGDEQFRSDVAVRSHYVVFADQIVCHICTGSGVSAIVMVCYSQWHVFRNHIGESGRKAR